MGYGDHYSGDIRIKSLAAVGLVHAAFVYVLITGLQYSLVRTSAPGLNVITIAPDLVAVPEPEATKIEKQAERKEAAAALPYRKADPVKIALPEPVMKLPKMNPVQAAPKAGDGDAPAAGSADKDGTGTGAAGLGDGRGSGKDGNGTGGGGVAVKARLKSGSITRKDYPRAARNAKAGGVSVVHFTVGANGRVSNCKVKQSSGRQDLDDTTCRLIEARFRYEPARDRQGNAVSYVTGWKQDWWLERGGRRVTD